MKKINKKVKRRRHLWRSDVGTKWMMEVKIVEDLIKNINKQYGQPCGELNINCMNCKGAILIAWLRWHLDNLEYEERLANFLANAANDRNKRKYKRIIK